MYSNFEPTYPPLADETAQTDAQADPQADVQTDMQAEIHADAQTTRTLASQDAQTQRTQRSTHRTSIDDEGFTVPSSRPKSSKTPAVHRVNTIVLNNNAIVEVYPQL